MRKRFSILLTVYCLIVGLLTPLLVTVIQDARLENGHFPLGEAAHYSYRGTLYNRVLALHAHLNHSPAVDSTTYAEGFAPEELWENLGAFLPLPEEASHTADTLLLTPRHYSAEYYFTRIGYSSDDVTMHVTADAETLLPVRIELKTTPDVMEKYAEEHSMYSILREYAALLNLGDASGDGNTHISTMMRSETDSLRGAPFTVTVTIMPTGGTLILKLEAVPSS